MPPLRKPRRTATLTGSFYDKSGAIADGAALASPTATTGLFRDAPRADAGSDDDGGMDSSDDEEYTLSGYGELSTNTPFTLPPSPTQTIKYRYRAYRPKLARIGKKHRASANGRTPLKTKSSAYHTSELSALAQGAYMSRGSPKHDFQALMQNYRDSAQGWRDSDVPALPRTSGLERTCSTAGSPLRRGGSGLVRSS